MYLRIETACIEASVPKKQAGRVQNRLRIKPLVVLLLLGCLLVVADASAQMRQANISVNHPAFVNAASINSEGSLALGEVNFAGSAQTAEVNQFDSSSATDALLPNAPSAMVQEKTLRAARVDDAELTPSSQPRVAPIYSRTIPAGWTAQPLSARDKQILGLRDLYSNFSLVDYVLLSAYSQIANGQPNYGTNADAYGKRVGATLLRDVSEGVFTDMVLAPAFHQDMRYYAMGPQHGLFHRVEYAITRPLIGRADDGHATLNGAKLLGYAGASALTYTYYPAINQNFHDIASTYGASLLGSAFGNLVREFAGPVLEKFHLVKAD